MKTNILFVDDEKLVLNGLRRMLAPKRNEWDMSFVTSGADALSELQKKPYDVIVTDLLMPGMDGNQLLMKVKNLFPEIKRIVLTGQQHREFNKDVVFPAHRYLMKPCDYTSLVNLLEDIIRIDEISMHKGLKGIISRIETLPSIPEIYTKITNELQSDDPSIDTISALISKDIALSSKLISLASSPYYGFGNVTEPRQAVIFFGLSMLHSLVLTVQAFSIYDPKKVPGFSVNMLWEHSKRVACYAKIIAKSLGRSEDQANVAFLSGILHDIGKLVLAAHFPGRYRRVLAAVGNDGMTVHDAEKEEFGTSHAEIGAYLMGLWGISAEVNKSISSHHDYGRISEDVTPAYELFASNIFDHVHVVINKEYSSRDCYFELVESLGITDKIEEWKKEFDSRTKDSNPC